MAFTFPNADWLEDEVAFDFFVGSHWLQGHVVHLVEINNVVFFGDHLDSIHFVFNLEVWDASQRIESRTPGSKVVSFDRRLVVEQDAVLWDTNDLDFINGAGGLLVNLIINFRI